MLTSIIPCRLLFGIVDIVRASHAYSRQAGLSVELQPVRSVAVSMSTRGVVEKGSSSRRERTDNAHRPQTID